VKLILETTIKPVPINEKLKRGRGKRMYINPEYAKTWEDIEWDWIRQLGLPNGKPLFKKPVVGIQIGWLKFDIDACIKPILDSLAKVGVYKDDKLVQGLSGVWRIPENKLIVTVEEMNVR